MSTTRAPLRPTPFGRPGRPAAPLPQPAAVAPPAARTVVGVRRLFRAENSTYFLVLGATLFLVAFGLVIVLSSSSVEAYATTGNPFTDFLKQGVFALIGVPLMLVASLAPPSFWRRWAWVALAGSLVLQLLIFTNLGVGNGYNRNWVSVGGIGFQPSEFIKLALIVWMGAVLSRKEPLLDDWRHALLPVGPVAILALALVMGGNDVGTAGIMLAIVFGTLFLAGVRLRHLLVWLFVVATLAIAVTFSGSSRASRIDSWLSGCDTPRQSQYCWQPVHGMWGLASGGVFGVGLGNSKMKWSWLPAADNDFIFAIIGEELGLIGVIVVLGLLVALAVGFVRVARSAADPAGRIIAGGVLLWIIGQALVNIAVVLGLLPVLGVPLPLISAGGSALITSLLGIGIVLSFARRPVERVAAEPGEADPAARSRAAARARAAAR
jgi:cell division protein FtsW